MTRHTKRMNCNQDAQAGFTASRGSADNLTLARIMAVMAEIPKPPPWHSCTAKPEHCARLRCDIPAMNIRTTFGAIRIYEKPGQVADAWMFSDDKILRKYLNGELTELDLFELMRTGACQPNSGKGQTQFVITPDTKHESTDKDKLNDHPT